MSATTYSRLNNAKKRELLKILCSNFLYDGENVVIKLKSTVEPMLLGANFNKCGHKEATLELLARKLYNNLRDKNNIIFFENLKLLKIA